jgi:hypothetical protein
VIGLRVDDVDGTKRLVHVEQSVEEVGGRIRIVSQLKSDASQRTFALPDVLLLEIASHISTFRSDAGPDDLLFVGPRGGVLRRLFEAPQVGLGAGRVEVRQCVALAVGQPALGRFQLGPHDPVTDQD